jgi:ACR3 family arsenite efflux pump ArsB
VNHPYFSLLILVKNLFFLIVVPLVLVGCLRLLFRGIITGNVLKRIKPLLSTSSGIIELFIIMISIALRASIIAEYPIIILWGVFTAALFYASSFIAAFYITRLFRFDYPTSIPLIYQNGSKNLPIAMVITITTFEQRAILGVAACILAQFPISALFYSIISRAKRQGLS